ncbi:MAG: hypothetical protein CMO63_02980 [Verrucomicrobiales bacterium]|nr:hypothetical protein [Verrucomicrobiales bacterium]
MGTRGTGETDHSLPRPLFVLMVRVLLLSAFLSASACSRHEGTDLAALDVVDSLYVVPETLEPFSGPVVRYFEEPSDRVQLEGGLLDGVFDGELVVYHRNGRVRYMGSFREGARCGPWTENADSTGTRDVHEGLLREVETLGLYPPCDG